MNRLRRRHLNITWLVCFILGAGIRVRGQSATGAIEGRVSDSQQLALPQPTVELQDARGNTVRKLIGEGNGHYQLDSVPPGMYTLQCSHNGFETARKGPVTVTDGRTTVLDVILQPQQVIQNITVVASVENDRLVASKTEIPLKDLPVTVQTVPLEVIQQQGATNIVDVVNNIPSAYAFTQYGGYDYFVFRGFQLDKDPGSAVLLNGMRIEGNRISSQINGVESVEILKGPASMLYGTEATGGTINIVEKKPLSTPLYEIVAQGGRWGRGGVEFGATGPLGSDNLLYRLDAGFLRSDGYRHESYRRFNVSPKLYWRISSRDQLNVHLTYNYDHSDLDAGIPLLTTASDSSFASEVPNIPLDRRFNIPGSFGKSNMPIVQVFYSHSFSEQVRLRQSFQYQYQGDEYWESEGLTVDPSTPTTVDRENLYFYHHNNSIVSQTDALASFNLLWNHQFLAGYEYDYLDHTTTRSSAASNASDPSIDLYNPVETATPITSFPASRYDGFQSHSNAIYLQDYIRIHSKIQFLAGMRYDAFRRHNFRNPIVGGEQTIGPSSDAAQNPVTYRVAMNAAVLPSLSLYSSYGTSFTGQTGLNDDGLPFSPSGVPYKPTTGGQFEAGARLSFFQNRLNLDASIFHIVQKNVVVFLTTNTFDQAGEQHSKGAEIELHARASQRLNLFANYGFTQAAFGNFVSGGVNFSGMIPAWVPRHTVRVWSSYDFPKGFGVSLGMRYVSKRSPDAADSLFFDGFTTWDTAFRYRRSKVEYSVNIANVLNKTHYYVSAITWNALQVYPGPPLDVSATVRYRF
jgi:iron complex outermembrane receptor protein